MTQWQQWIPNRKVTAGAFAAAIAFILVLLLDDPLGLTAAESIAAGGALAAIVAYLVPERNTNGG